MQELSRFPRLHAQLVEVVSELLRERLGPTSEYAQSLIEIQAAYINTNHPAFITGSAIHSANTPAPQQTQTPSRVRFILFHVLPSNLMPSTSQHLPEDQQMAQQLKTIMILRQKTLAA